MDSSAFSPALMAYAASRNSAPPPHFGIRYDAAGAFQREPGNTVVCHLVEGSATEAALIAARETYLGMPEAAQFAFTPVSSLHMTLFQGIIASRRTRGYWPPDLPLDTSVDEMTGAMGGRLADLDAGPHFAVEVIAARPSGLVVAGASAADRAAMQVWRDALADLWGYRHPDHESYVFHITFAYPIRWLDDAALPAWQRMLDDVVADIRRATPILELRRPAFCRFEDMNHFEELLPLPFAS
jgi:hypothetical protein